MTKRFMIAAKAVLAVAAVFATASCSRKEILFDRSSQTVAFQCPAPFDGKVVNVWYNIPEGVKGKADVQFVMHGDGRNADTYFKAWKAFSDSLGFVLIVPEFDKEQFPVSLYHQGNVMAADSSFNASEDRVYKLIDGIFEFFVDHSEIKADRFNIYGHSAGGQFVHRFMMLGGSRHVGRAVAANPGWYSFPTDSVAWPYGAMGLVTADEKKSFYAKDMVVLLGEADTLRYNNNLHISPAADAQGLNRLERGKTYFEWCRRDAESLGLDFNWELEFVPGVGHSNTKMAPAAVKVLYPQQ